MEPGLRSSNRYQGFSKWSELGVSSARLVRTDSRLQPWICPVTGECAFLIRNVGATGLRITL